MYLRFPLFLPITFEEKHLVNCGFTAMNLFESEFNKQSSSSMEKPPSYQEMVAEQLRQKEDNKFYLKLKSFANRGVDIGSLIVEGDEGGNTWLIASSAYGATDIVELILSSIPRTYLFARNNKHETAFDVADNDEIKKMLLDAEKGKFPTIGLKEVKNR